MLKTKEFLYSSLAILAVTSLLLCNYSFAYDNEVVHPTINENAVKQSNFYLGTTIESLSFVTPEEKDKVVNWLKQGGTDEDDPVWALRYARHFHDPLKSWDQAGLSIPLLPEYKSSVIWSQNIDQEFSWQKARTYYYNGLLGSEADLAKAFKTLGHMMHLLSDMAVPAHVRNDSHPIDLPVGVMPTWQKDPYKKYVTVIRGQVSV